MPQHNLPVFYFPTFTLLKQNQQNNLITDETKQALQSSSAPTSMDPDGVYCGNHHHRPPPEPSAPPIDQDCLLSAPRTASLDPPEEDMAALTMDHGSSGRAHNLEPSGLTDDCHDGVINPVAATYAIPSISDTNLPVASAVPIVTDAVEASIDTCVANRKASSSSERDSSTTPSATTSSKTTNQKKASGNKPKEGSLGELRLRRQERERAAQRPSSDGQRRDANGKLVEPQPSRKERQSGDRCRAKPNPQRDNSIGKKSSSRRPTPSFFKKDDGNTEWDQWLEKQRGKTSPASTRRPIPSFFHEKKI